MHIAFLAMGIAASVPAPVQNTSPTPAEIVVVGIPDALEGARKVPDQELATMRGGMLLPNGLDVTIGIDIRTRVDGILQLHTLYQSSGPNAGISVYRDGTDAGSYIPGSTVVQTPTDGSQPGIIIDRSPTGTTVWSVTQTSFANVGVIEAPSSSWPAVAGEEPVPVTANGGPVTEPDGTYTLTSSDGGTIAKYATDTISIEHLIGQATGAVVLNTASDRVIDTTSTVAVDLGNFPVAEVASALALDAMALDLTRGR